jgi:FkbM family methyltransferase
MAEQSAARNWSGFRHNVRVGITNMLKVSGVERMIQQCRAAPVVTTRYGVRMVAHWDDKTFRLCYFGAYGYVLPRLFAAQDAPYLFLDIGANQGLYSLIAAKTAHCRLALAFEPVPETYARLVRNIDENALGGRVRALNLAVSDQAGAMQIQVVPGHSGASSMADGNPLTGAASVTIQCIDQSALDAEIPDGLPIVVKVDVEGLEAVVLAQLLNSRHLAAIVAINYEVDEAWVDPARLEALLRTAGFARFRKIGGANHYDVLATR